MNSFKKIVCALIFSSAILPSIGYAGNIVSCGINTINNFYINGQRDDGLALNDLEVVLESACNGYTVVYASMDNPAYNSFLSVVMMAFTTGEKIHVYLNPSKNNQIALMHLTK